MCIHTCMQFDLESAYSLSTKYTRRHQKRQKVPFALESLSPDEEKDFFYCLKYCMSPFPLTNSPSPAKKKGFF